MTVFFITFGCKVNCYETECLKSDFIKNGFELSPSENADIIVVNSCTVTSESDKKLRQTLHRLKKLHPESTVVLTGCFPQAFPEKASLTLPADVITGTKNKSETPLLVKQYLENLPDSPLIKVEKYSKDDPFDEMRCSFFEDKTRAFIKIQDGCNQFCSYCIIPYSRGRIRSKAPEKLKEEIEGFAASGHKEMVLTGINLAFYGWEYGLSLTDAVEICCSVPGVERVRLGSLEPEKISDSDLARLSKLSQFCPQFHLSLQSGCEKTLKDMNRKYTAAEYAALVEKIRSIFPDASVTTDVMTGFPGETEEDFLESLEFVKKIGFSKIHVFPYSVRTGTKAASMPLQLSHTVKNERAARMALAGKESEQRFLEAQTGKTFPVLFEKENCTDFHQGYSPNYTLVKIPRCSGINSLRNKIFYVNIKRAMNDFCIGEIQTPEK